MEINKKAILIWFIVLYQLLGGLLGVYYTIISIEASDSFSEIFLNFFIILPIFIFSVVSAIMLLWKRKWKYSLVNLFLQIIQFKIGSIAFYYTAGSYLGIGYKFGDDFFLNFSETASFVLIKINSSEGKSILGLNLISLFLFLIVYYFATQNQVDKVGNGSNG